MRMIAGDLRPADGRVTGSRSWCPAPAVACFTVGVSRNAQCPCGSGRKYKRCCLAAAEEHRRAEYLEAEVGHRIQDWAIVELSDELDGALEEFCAAQTDRHGGDRSLSDADIDLFSAWFHNDRVLPEGDTPAERYACRPDLDAGERVVAGRIASARLGLHRVITVEPGEWIQLEDLLSGNRVTVASATVSDEVTRWDLLLGRVMVGARSSLWGAARVLAPQDEPDLMTEFARLAGGDGLADDATIARALEYRPLDVLRFRPPSWDVPPTFVTLEGDPLADASATWQTTDTAEAERLLRQLGQLEPRDEPEIGITVSRDLLVGQRGDLPPGAIVLEETAYEDLDSVSIATLRLVGDGLIVEAMSEARLQRAIEIVEGDYGTRIHSREIKLVSVERRLEERRASSPETVEAETGLDDETERELLESFLTDRMRRWVDDPNSQLDGLTPRQAASGARRADVVRLVRAIENGAERARRRGEPQADLSWLPQELEIEDPLVA